MFAAMMFAAVMFADCVAVWAAADDDAAVLAEVLVLSVVAAAAVAVLAAVTVWNAGLNCLLLLHHLQVFLWLHSLLWSMCMDLLLMLSESMWLSECLLIVLLCML